MKIKDQIRTRREQLGVTIDELGRRVGVSHQAVRYWESGRSFPGKSKAPKLEDALSFRLDWTEGVRSRTGRPDITALLDQEDIEIMLTIRKLPPVVKQHLGEMAKLYMDALDARIPGFNDREMQGGVESFSVREPGGGISRVGGPIKKSQPRQGRATQKRAA